MPRTRSRSPRLHARLALLLSASLTMCLLAGTAHADWPSSPLTNVPVCTAPGFQTSPKLVTDGAGGAIVLWADQRAADPDVYVGRVLADGSIAPGWPLNGRAVCTAPGSQVASLLVSDRLGGALIAWHDSRGGSGTDLYASHVLSDGSIDPDWPTDGLLVCSADSSQFITSMIPDGAGGAYLCWRDLRSRTNNDIYLQHIRASGVEDPNWPDNGLPVCTAAGDQLGGQLVLSAAGGVFVVWGDARSGVSDIYAQRVLANGVTDPAWPVNGAPVCTAAGAQQLPKIAPDGTGGAFLVWQDLRSGAADLYASRIMVNGVLDSAWPVDGAPLCTALGDQDLAGVAASGPGGAVVVWRDKRGSLQDIYAARLLAGGLDPAWSVNGVGVCLSVGDQTNPVIAADGAGGALLAWGDSRSGNSDIYVHHVLQSGVADPAWPLNGRPVCQAANSQQVPDLMGDGAGGAILAWHDARTAGITDIYAQRVQPDGTLGGTVVDVSPPAGLSFVIQSAHPNPWRGGPLHVELSNATEGEVSLEVLDVAGRRLLARDLGTLAPGRHSATVDVGARARAGVRFVRLRQGEETRSLRVSVVE